MAKNHGKKEFLVPSDLTEVQKNSARVFEFLRPLGLNEGQAFDIRLCLEEAVINAMKYGNRFDKNLHVRVGVDYDDRRIELSVEDQGKGFKPEALADCTKGE